MAMVSYDPRQGAARAATRASQGWKKFWSGFTTGQKVVTTLAVLALLAAVVVFSRFASSPSYRPLFSSLSAKDAAAITSKLHSSGVPYKLANGGTTVEVPASQVDSERLAMAGAGLPQAGTGAGLSLLSKTGITTSQLSQRADYQRAIQDELARTIDSIQGVKGSQVAVVLPSQSAFALGNAQKSSASVMLDLSGGTTLSPSQVGGIAHLVASAVPDLSSSAVTVVDSAGTLLSGPGASSGPAASLSSAQAYDTALEASLTSMLDQVVGAGNAQVRVAATLASANTKTVAHAIQVVPKTTKPLQAASSITKSTQSFKGTGVVPGGVLGTNTVTAAGGKSAYTKGSSTTKYETGVVDTTTVQPPGQVSRLSVSAVVNRLPKGVTLASLRQAVSAAAGIVPARGDTLSVVAVPFSTAVARSAAAAAKAAAAARSKARLVAVAKDGAVALAILVALVVLWRKSKKKAPAPPAQMPQPAQLGVADSLGMDHPTAAIPVVPADPVEELAARPDVASRVLSAWLSEPKPRATTSTGGAVK